MTVLDVFANLARNPWRHLVRRWNWKAAATSSLWRALIFFSTNISAGLKAAVSAMGIEFVYRIIASGFYGAITQSFRTARPAWAASLTAMVFVPLLTHTFEFLVHWMGGTKKLATSIIASASFSAFSTLFNLFAMRRGVMVVGEGAHSVIEDLRRFPGLILEFAQAGATLLRASARRIYRLSWGLRPDVSAEGEKSCAD